jgi:peptide/nickel transport system permease protein
MRRVWRFLHNWRNWVGVLLISFIIGLAIVTPLLAPQEDPANPQYLHQVGRSTDTVPRPPSEKALLGTLPRQYDVFYSLLWGLRQAIGFGLSVSLVAASFGVIYGATSAYLGGLANNVMMRITDAFLTVPVLAAVVFMRQIIVVLLEKTGILLIYPGFIPQQLSRLQEFLMNSDPMLWSLILLSWMPYARLVNASVIRLRDIDYVVSARALGASHRRIILRHLLPNVLSPEIVMAARDVGGMVILQATFTFIGLGGNSPWGAVLATARDWVVGPGGNPFRYWWTYLPVTFAIILFSMSWNFLGDSLNEWFNPRKVC